MIFTNKVDYDIPEEGVKLMGRRINQVKSVKYLGIRIDSKLTFEEHLTEKVKSCKRILFGMKAFCDKNWGPAPEMMHYAYTSKIRPILSYCCFAFTPRLKQHQIEKLERLQRLCLMMMGNFRRNTATQNLNIITDTIPIELYLKRESLRAGIRLNKHLEFSWTGIGSGKQIGHVKPMKDKLTELNIYNENIDNIPGETDLDNNYVISKDFTGNDMTSGLRLYTDGSKMQQGVGAGACLLQDDEVLDKAHVGLSQKATIFQAEGRGIRLAASMATRHEIWKEKDKVTILTDSQALKNPNTSCKTIKEAKESLNELGQKIQIEIKWIKAHIHHPGNEIADEEAKKGTLLPDMEEVPLNKVETNAIIDDHIYELWNKKMGD